MFRKILSWFLIIQHFNIYTLHAMPGDINFIFSKQKNDACNLTFYKEKETGGSFKQSYDFKSENPNSCLFELAPSYSFKSVQTSLDKERRFIQVSFKDEEESFFFRLYKNGDVHLSNLILKHHFSLKTFGQIILTGDNTVNNLSLEAREITNQRRLTVQERLSLKLIPSDKKEKKIYKVVNDVEGQINVGEKAQVHIFDGKLENRGRIFAADRSIIDLHGNSLKHKTTFQNQNHDFRVLFNWQGNVSLLNINKLTIEGDMLSVNSKINKDYSITYGDFLSSLYIQANSIILKSNFYLISSGLLRIDCKNRFINKGHIYSGKTVSIKVEDNFWNSGVIESLSFLDLFILGNLYNKKHNNNYMNVENGIIRSQFLSIYVKNLIKNEGKFIAGFLNLIFQRLVNYNKIHSLKEGTLLSKDTSEKCSIKNKKEASIKSDGILKIKGHWLVNQGGKKKNKLGKIESFILLLILDKFTNDGFLQSFARSFLKISNKQNLLTGRENLLDDAVINTDRFINKSTFLAIKTNINYDFFENYSNFFVENVEFDINDSFINSKDGIVFVKENGSFRVKKSLINDGLLRGKKDFDFKTDIFKNNNKIISNEVISIQTAVGCDPVFHAAPYNDFENNLLIASKDIYLIVKMGLNNFTSETKEDLQGVVAANLLCLTIEESFTNRSKFYSHNYIKIKGKDASFHTYADVISENLIKAQIKRFQNYNNVKSYQADLTLDVFENEDGANINIDDTLIVTANSGKNDGEITGERGLIRGINNVFSNNKNIILKETLTFDGKGQLCNLGRIHSYYELVSHIYKIDNWNEIFANFMEFHFKDLANKEDAIFHGININLNGEKFENDGVFKSNNRFSLYVRDLKNNYKIMGRIVDLISADFQNKKNSNISGEIVGVNTDTGRNEGAIEGEDTTVENSDTFTNDDRLHGDDQLTTKGSGHFENNGDMTSSNLLNATNDKITNRKNMSGKKVSIKTKHLKTTPNSNISGEIVGVKTVAGHNEGAIEGGNTTVENSDTFTNDDRLHGDDQLTTKGSGHLENNGYMTSSNLLSVTNDKLTNRKNMSSNQVSIETKHLKTTPNSKIYGEIVGVNTDTGHNEGIIEGANATVENNDTFTNDNHLHGDDQLTTKGSGHLENNGDMTSSNLLSATNDTITNRKNMSGKKVLVETKHLEMTPNSNISGEIVGVNTDTGRNEGIIEGANTTVENRDTFTNDNHLHGGAQLTTKGSGHFENNGDMTSFNLLDATNDKITNRKNMSSKKVLVETKHLKTTPNSNISGEIIGVNTDIGHNEGTIKGENTTVENRDTFTNDNRLHGDKELTTKGSGHLENNGDMTSFNLLSATNDTITNRKNMSSNQVSIKTKHLKTTPNSNISGEIIGVNTDIGHNEGTIKGENTTVENRDIFTNDNRLHGDKKLTTKGSGHFENNGDMTSDGNLSIENTLTNNHYIKSHSTMKLSGQEWSVNNGKMISEEKTNIETDFETEGLTQSKDVLRFFKQLIVKKGGVVVSEKDIEGEEESLLLNDGLVLSYRDFILKQNKLDNRGFFKIKNDFKSENLISFINEISSIVFCENGSFVSPLLNYLKNDGFIDIQKSLTWLQLLEVVNNGQIKTQDQLIWNIKNSLKNKGLLMAKDLFFTAENAIIENDAEILALNMANIKGFKLQNSSTGTFKSDGQVIADIEYLNQDGLVTAPVLDLTFKIGYNGQKEQFLYEDKGILASQKLRMGIEVLFSNYFQLLGKEKIYLLGDGTFLNNGRIHKTDVLESYVKTVRNNGVIRTYDLIKINTFFDSLINNGLMLSKDIELESNEDIVNEENCIVEARGGNLKAGGKKVENNGLMSCVGGKAVINAVEAINNRLLRGNIVEVNTDTGRNKGTIEGEDTTVENRDTFTNDNRLHGDDQLTTKGSGHLENNGDMTSFNLLSATNDTITNRKNMSGKKVSVETKRLKTTQNSNISGEIVGVKTVAGHNEGAIEGGNTTVENSDTFTNDDRLHGDDQLTTKGSGHFENNGDMTSSNLLSATNDKITNRKNMSSKRVLVETKHLKTTPNSNISGEIVGVNTDIGHNEGTIEGENTTVGVSDTFTNDNHLHGNEGLTTKGSGHLENNGDMTSSNLLNATNDKITNRKNMSGKKVLVETKHLETTPNSNISGEIVGVNTDIGHNEGTIEGESATVENNDTFTNDNRLHGNEELTTKGSGHFENNGEMTSSNLLNVTNDKVTNRKNMSGKKVLVETKHLEMTPNSNISGEIVGVNTDTGHNEGTIEGENTTVGVSDTFTNNDYISGNDQLTTKGQGVLENDGDMVSRNAFSIQNKILRNKKYVQSDGSLTVHENSHFDNQATAAIKGNILVDYNAKMTNTNKASIEKELTIKDKGTLDNKGIMNVQGTILIEKEGSLDNEGTLQSNDTIIFNQPYSHHQGIMRSTKDIALNNTSTLKIDIGAEISSSEGEIKAPLLENLDNEGLFSSCNEINLNHLKSINNKGVIQSECTVEAKLNGPLMIPGRVAAPEKVDLEGTEVHIHRADSKSVTLKAKKDMTITGNILGIENINVVAPVIHQKSGSFETEKGKVSLAGGRMILDGQTKGDDIDLTCFDEIFQFNRENVQAIHSLMLTAPHGWDMKSIPYEAQLDLTVNAPILNAASFNINGNLTWTGATQLHQYVSFILSGRLTLRAPNCTMINREGVQANKGMDLTLAGIENYAPFHSGNLTKLTLTNGIDNYTVMDFVNDLTVSGSYVHNHPGACILQHQTDSKVVFNLNEDSINERAIIRLDGHFNMPKGRSFQNLSVKPLTISQTENVPYLSQSDFQKLGGWRHNFPGSGNHPYRFLNSTISRTVTTETLPDTPFQRAFFSAQSVNISNIQEFKNLGSHIDVPLNFICKAQQSENTSYILKKSGSKLVPRVAAINNKDTSRKGIYFDERAFEEPTGVTLLAQIFSQKLIDISNLRSKDGIMKGATIELSGAELNLLRSFFITPADITPVPVAKPAFTPVLSYVKSNPVFTSFYKEDVRAKALYKEVPTVPIYTPSRKEIQIQLRNADIPHQDVRYAPESLTEPAPQVAVMGPVVGNEKFHQHPAVLAGIVMQIFFSFMEASGIENPLRNDLLNLRVLEQAGYDQACAANGVAAQSVSPLWSSLSAEEKAAYQQREMITGEQAELFSFPALVYQSQMVFDTAVLSGVMTLPRALREKLPPKLGQVLSDYLKVDVMKFENQQDILVKKKAKVGVQQIFLNDHGHVDGGQNLKVLSGITENKSGTLIGDDVLIEGDRLLSERLTKREHFHNGFQDVLDDEALIQSRVKDITLKMMEKIQLKGARVKAAENVNFSGDVALMESTQLEGDREDVEGNKDYRKTTHTHTLNQESTLVEAGNDFNVNMKTLVRLQGADLDVGNKTIMNVEEGSYESLVTHNQIEQTTTEHEDGGFWGNKSTTHRQFGQQKVVKNKIKSGGLTIITKEDQHHQATDFQTKTAPKLISKKKVELSSAKNYRFENVQREAKSLAWQCVKSFGGENEDIILSTFTVPPVIEADEEVVIEVPEKYRVSDLAKNPQTAWLAHLYEQSSNTHRWVEIKEAHKEWHRKQEGLSQAASMLLAIAIAAATGGSGFISGAGLIGGSGALGAMATAGFSAICSTAGLSLINNQGNLKKVFRDIGSKSSLKNLAISVASAGLMNATGLAAASGGKASVHTLSQQSTQASLWTLDHLTHHLKTSMLKAGVNAGVSLAFGEDVKIDQLVKEASLNAVADYAGEALAGKIKESYVSGEVGSVGHKVLHGAVGAFCGALLNPEDPLHGAASGAVGAFMAETVAEGISGQQSRFSANEYVDECRRTGVEPTKEGYYDYMISAVYTHPDRDEMVRTGEIAKVVGATGALFTGLNPDIAFRAGSNAIDNNFLNFLVPVMVVGSTLWTAYEVNEAYKVGGVEAALKKLGIEICIAAIGGVVFKGAFKVGGIAYKTSAEAIAAVVDKSPGLKLALGNLETVLSGYMAKAANSAFKSLASKGNGGKRVRFAEPGKQVDAQKVVVGNNTNLQSKVVKSRAKSNKGIYDSHEIRGSLEKKYPGAVSSTTVPDSKKINVKLAGKRHPVSGIVFDKKGFPIFDDVAKFDTKISREFAQIKSRKMHMREATKNLREQINSGKVNPSQFSEKQLKEIQKGFERIPGFTWHHHQDMGRMQLIPLEVHQKTAHVGGMDLWPFKG